MAAPVFADRVKAHVRQVGLIALGDQQLDVSALAQLVELSQTRAISEALQLLHQVTPLPRLRAKLRVMTQQVPVALSKGVPLTSPRLGVSVSRCAT